jgi:hypothetical protein
VSGPWFRLGCRFFVASIAFQFASPRELAAIVDLPELRAQVHGTVMSASVGFSAQRSFKQNRVQYRN